MAISDEMLIAYLGGKLSEADRKAVDDAVERDPGVAERLRRHREVGAMIQDAISAGGRPRRRAPAAGGGPAPIVSLAEARKTREAPPAQVRPPRVRKPIDARWGALAAGLIIGIGIGVFAPRPQTGLIDGDLQARGVLAASLETALAAEQKPNAAVRIGMTFRNREGDWCRTFAAREGTSGVACRGGDGWAVRMVERGSTRAGSTTPAVKASVNGMIAGAPVDADAERKARAGAWP